ncbi:hypothetical protein BTVI_84833 [Pitangus sulphuratus]|nr:hypothetical protein BTVI_84833 [Pitangus sulphuratus]
MTRLVDEKKAVDVVYLGFSKAFDIVSHSILLKKLAAHGLERGTLYWVENWLEGRAQRVLVNGVASGIIDRATYTCGYESTHSFLNSDFLSECENC